MANSNKIAVGMSGGVDSSVAALLLKQAGYDVMGFNLNLWSCFKDAKAKACCNPVDRRDAARVCDILKIPLITVDMRELFKEEVIKNFVGEYSRGRTPNPCVRCNSKIKFAAIIDMLKKNYGVENIATGHYARIESDGASYKLLRGLDKAKDQSYFLFGLRPESLGNIKFPLGGYVKKDVRAIALENRLPVAEKSESQEVCFIPDNDVASFIEDYYSQYSRPSGNFIDNCGVALGRHRGTHAYTIGQRRGLGVALGERRYVTEIRPETAEVVLGDDSDLFKTSLYATDLNFFEDMGAEFRANVKIRYKSDGVPANVKLLENGTAHAVFDKPVRAVTPGQAAVFYDGDIVIGGGWIV